MSKGLDVAAQATDILAVPARLELATFGLGNRSPKGEGFELSPQPPLVFAGEERTVL